MKRQVGVLVLLLVLFSASLAPGVAVSQTQTPPEVPDHLRAFSIVPPGQEGNVTAAELITGNYGPHYSDQLEMYASLIDDDDVTEEELKNYFHPMQFGPGAEIEDTYSPKDGVTVFRDNFGIPHIYADSLDNASFALGYVTAQDRMFEMDAFRHAARGQLAEFIGAGDDDANLESDIATRREGYTPEEVQRMYDRFDEKFGATGEKVQSGLKAYADGVNAWFEEVRNDPSKCDAAYNAGTSESCPAEIHDWEVLDTLYLVILQLRVFGETAGGELQNAGLYAFLTEKHGIKLGRKMYEDLLRRNDPRSPTTLAPADGRFPSQNLGRTSRASFAIPDDAEKLATEQAQAAAVRTRVLQGLGFPTGSMSNALLVSADRSASGNPLQIGAPQVGQAVPAFFLDVDVHAPGVDFRGPAVPGASALVPLGRGTDYAWSLTTGYSDAVDTRVELLCDPKGGEPKQDSTGYMFKGKCREMQSRVETFQVNPTPVAPQQPRTEERTFYRTKHGPVFARGKVNGKPVAFVKQRFFWKKELDSVPQFYRWNAEVDSVQDFADAAEDFTMSFNSFYADAQDIGYFHVGFYPKRPQGYHPSLPTWGTGRWEWQGRIPFTQHPRAINPSTGWAANWNNKPAVGWDNMDGPKWGPVHRVQLLQDKMNELLGAGDARLSDLVDVIREAATQDARGVYLGPKMLSFVAGSVEESAAPALQAVKEWVETGSHRKNKDRDDEMDNGPALAMFDEWYDQMVHRIFDDELGTQGYGLLAAPMWDYDPAQAQCCWFDFSSYVKNLFSAKSRDAYARNYCDDITTTARETCADMVSKAFATAFAKLKNEQGDDVSAWTKPAENIVFQEFGAGSVDPIPWQNRGTHNHAVEVLRDDSEG